MLVVVHVLVEVVEVLGVFKVLESVVDSEDAVLTADVSEVLLVTLAVSLTAWQDVWLVVSWLAMIDVSIIEVLVWTDGNSELLAVQTEATRSIKLNGRIFAFLKTTARCWSSVAGSSQYQIKR